MKQEAGFGTIMIYLAAIILLVAGLTSFLLNFAIKAEQVTVGKSAGELRAFGPTFHAGEFIVRLSNNGRYTRFLRTEVVFETDHGEAVKHLQGRIPQVKDLIISVLCSRSDLDFSPEGVEALRQELVARVNELLPRGEVVQAYFTQFVMQ